MKPFALSALLLLTPALAWSQPQVTVPVPSDLINDGKLLVTGRAGSGQADTFEYARVHTSTARPGDVLVDETGTGKLGQTLQLKSGTYELSYSNTRYGQLITVAEGTTTTVALVEINVPLQDGSYQVEAFVDLSAAEERQKILALGDSQLFTLISPTLSDSFNIDSSAGYEACDLVKHNPGEDFDFKAKPAAKKLCSTLAGMQAGQTIAPADLPIQFGPDGSYTTSKFTFKESDYAYEGDGGLPALLFNLVAHQTWKSGRIRFDAVTSAPQFITVVDPHDGDTISVFPGSYLFRFTGSDGSTKTVKVSAQGGSSS